LPVLGVHLASSVSGRCQLQDLSEVLAAVANLPD
jgi:hypothetical protein